jgi:hypothetical protein
LRERVVRGIDADMFNRISCVLLLVGLSGSIACSSSTTPAAESTDGAGPSSDAATDTASEVLGDTATTGPDLDAFVPDAPVVYPAFTLSMPSLVAASTPPRVLAQPIVRLVYFQGDTRVAVTDAAISAYLASRYWTALAEYGVGAATKGADVMVPTAAPGSVSSSDATAWLAGELDGTHAEVGTLDATALASTIFVVMYPSTTTFLVGSAQNACDGGLASFNASVATKPGAVAQAVVSTGCNVDKSLPDGMGVVAYLTGALAAASTNPLSLDGRSLGWRGFDDAHAIVGNPFDGVGTACDPDAPWSVPDLPFPIVPTWSNAASAARRWPCTPSPTTAYFTATPVVTDTATVGGVTVPAVLLPAGGTAHVDLELWSDAPTSGAWALSAEAGDASVHVSFSSPSGINGDHVTMTVTGSLASGASTILEVDSTLGAVRSRQFVNVVGR